MKNEVTITKDDFNAAISATMQNNMKDPHFEGHLESAMIYVMGGATFAREVMKILFGEEDKTDE